MNDTLELDIPIDADAIHCNAIIGGQYRELLKEVRLEIPLCKATVKSTGFSKRLSNLYIRMNKNKSYNHLYWAKLLEANKPVGKEICITQFYPIRSFENIDIQGDYSYNPKLDYCIVKDVNVLATLLEKWESDELIVFYINESQCADIFAKIMNSVYIYSRFLKWFAFSINYKYYPRRPRYENFFLKRIGTCDMFLFYNKLRESYNIFGKKPEVINFYKKAKEILEV